MPLLHKQKFIKKPIPTDLQPDEEIFYCKLTQEIFRDYDLVWTCYLTGKTGLTYAEAIESEKKARKSLASLPSVIEKALLYAITLTKRGNIKDVADDVFSFVKDRYFIGENILVPSIAPKNDQSKLFKIVDIIIPTNGSGRKELNRSSSQVSNEDENREDDVIDVEMEHNNELTLKNSQKQPLQPGPLIDASKIKYVIESQKSRQTIRANQINRLKNQVTKEKIYMMVRAYCEVNSQQMWTLTEATRHKYLQNYRFSDVYRGNLPVFESSYGRGQFSRQFQKSQSSTDLKSSQNQSNNKQKSQKSAQDDKNSTSKSFTSQNTSKSKSNQKQNESLEECSESNFSETCKIVQIMCKKTLDMTEEEFNLWRDYLPDDDIRDIVQIEQEWEKIVKREEREKEKERIKLEKNKQREYLKELKNPKEDLECDFLQDLPKPEEIKSKIRQDMLGDSIMILEFLNYFGELFELKDDFPNGFNLDFLENALFSKSCDSALCNLLLFYLDSIFKCYDEETFGAHDNTTESDTESMADTDLNDPQSNNDDSSEHLHLDKLLYNDPNKGLKDRDAFIEKAEEFFKFIKNSQGKSLKNIGLDVYTISEMLRLYFITSGSSHTSKTKFWYQQRGGYTRMDETGIDFALNEREIINKLEYMNVYELEPEEKLKILTTLCHQLMSQVRFRDLIEDNWHKLTGLKAQLRDLQTEENRRLREETSERWKKKLEMRAKEKAAKLEENNSKPNKERNSLSNDSSSILNANSIKEESKEDIENSKQLKESNKKRNEFLKKEKHLIDEIYELQVRCSMYPLGRDRLYRRYWIFKSLPGVFVEEDDEYSQASSSLTSNSCITNNDCDTSDTGNDGKENKPTQQELALNNKDQNQIVKTKANNLNKSNSVTNSSTRWLFYYTPDTIESLINSLNERGIRESELKQGLAEFKQKITDDLNHPVKIAIIKNLTMSQEDIEKGIKNCLKENVSNVLANISTNQPKGKQRHTSVSAAAAAANHFQSLLNSNTTNTNGGKNNQTDKSVSYISSNEYMEMDLRDKLLDIEEQIYAGSLGSLKVNDRTKWKDALSKNKYDPQCSQLSWADNITKPANECTNFVTSSDGFEQFSSQLLTVNNLAKALLQIEQSVERRFLRTPLGEAQKTPEKKGKKKGTTVQQQHHHPEEKSHVLINWERTLMNSKTLSQLFIHLQTLDESIAWSKSVLNARCKLCKKKGDADRMLLCDKCDCGHHIFCLRPPLKSIPEGEWFCAECKPSVVEKAPRKIRKSFKDQEVYSDEADHEENDEQDVNEEENDLSDEEDNDDEKSDTSNKELDDENEEMEDDTEEIQNETDEMSTLIDNETTRDETMEEDDDINHESTNDVTDNVSDDGESRSRTKRPKKKSKYYNDEDYVIDGNSNSSSKQKTARKRKLEEVKVETKKPAKAESPKQARNLISVPAVGRMFRNRKQKMDYNELSDDVSKSGTDDDQSVRTSRRLNGKLNDNSNSNSSHSNSANSNIVNNTSSRNTEMAQRLKLMEKILNDLMKHKDAWPFLKPVSKRDAPDYYEIITKPMDFSTIKNNKNNFKYNDYTHIIDDVRLVFENCRTYNEPGSDIYETGERLSQYFESQAKKSGLLDTKQLALPNS